MKLNLLSALLLTAFTMAAYSEETGRLEMWEEPSHQLVFKHEMTRLLDIRVPTGATSEYHSHHYATIYVILEDALLMNQEHGTKWKSPIDRPYRPAGVIVDRAVYVDKPSYHRVKNSDGRTFHLFSVVNMGDRVSSAGDSPTKAKGGLLDNPWFREHRIKLGPSETSDTLSYQMNAVLVQFDDGPSHIVQNKVSHSFKTTPGSYSWHPAGNKFQVVNDRDKANEFILIEIKE